MCFCFLGSMGDGVSFPQRHMDEDEDALLGGGRAQQWMDEGGNESTRLEANPYRTISSNQLKINVLTTFLLQMSSMSSR